MKLLKALVRTTQTDGVICALEEARAPGITVSRVHGVGYGYEPMLLTLAPCELDKAPKIPKAEVVCQDEDVDRLLQVLADAPDRTADRRPSSPTWRSAAGFLFPLARSLHWLVIEPVEWRTLERIRARR